MAITAFEQSNPLPRSGKPQLADASTLHRMLKGQILHVPDLNTVFRDWPWATNRNIARLEWLVDNMLESLARDPRKLRGLKAADFARLIAMWYPTSNWEQLVTITAYVLWIFVWDDEMEDGDQGIAESESEARAYTELSKAYVRATLALDENDEQLVDVNGDRGPGRAPFPWLAVLEDFGKALRQTLDLPRRERFFTELCGYMDGTLEEHLLRLHGTMPNVPEYMRIRMGSIGVAPQMALSEYALGIRLPSQIMKSDAMKNLWKQTTVINLILNDVYSAQKEAAQGSLLNLVPVTYNDPSVANHDIATVSASLLESLTEGISKFETASSELLHLAQSHPDALEDTQKFVEWCRVFTTAILVWSLTSKRYGMIECMQVDESHLVAF